MKRIFIFLLFIASFSGFSQAVTVDTSTRTVPQLVNDVLINSPCFNATNITWSTGTNFGSTNGIGYFANTNPNFPFATGVVLTTGDVTKAPSPNNSVLSDGTAAWPGDADLQTALTAAGAPIASVNATVLEFDFIAAKPDFDFGFVFASEEYGTSQCSFSDAFAFLLTNTSTGVTTNLATVPGQGNTPISVSTIRDNTYNNNCPSVNPSFFGRFNGTGFGPAINFNGQTVKMTASASGLTIGTSYHIKIVIADGGNNVGYDSAIFLEGNSFNVGQNVLGIDYVPANASNPSTPRNGFCPGATLPTLTTGLAATSTFVWKKGTTVIPGESGPSLVLQGNTNVGALATGQNTFSVTYTEPGCDPYTDEIIVELFPAINAMPTVPPIYVCNTGATNYTFDLTKNTTIIKAGANAGAADDLPAATVIKYYLSNIAAQNGGPSDLPTSYSIPAADNNMLIYARIESPTSPCYEIRSFQLKIVAAPLISAVPAPQTLCARDYDPTPRTRLLDLSSTAPTSVKNIVLGGQDPAVNIVTFHSSPAGANSTINNTTSPLNPTVVGVNGPGYLLTQTRTVYVRIQNASNPDCFVSTSFVVTVTPLAQVDILDDVIVCTQYILPPLTYAGSEYRTAANGNGVPIAVATPITTNSTIHVYNGTGGCPGGDSFTVTIANLPSIAPTGGDVCTKFTFPSLTYGKYFPSAGGVGGEIAEGTEITAPGPHTYYVRYEDTVNSCVVETSFSINIINFQPLPATGYPNRFSCNPTTLGADPNGGTYYGGPNKTGGIISPTATINTTRVVYVYKESGTTFNCTDEKSFTIFIGVTSYVVPADQTYCTAQVLTIPVGQYSTLPNGGGTVYSDGDTLSTAGTTTLHPFVPGQACINSLPPFTITIENSPLPPMPNIGPVCGYYDLPDVSALHDGDYFLGPNGTGPKLTLPYTVTSTQTIYFYDVLPGGTCPLQNQFTVTVNPIPAIDIRPDVIKCNSCYTLDDLVNGEYYAAPGGPANGPALAPGMQFCNDTILYVYAGSTLPNTCFEEYAVNIFITNTTVAPIADVFKCTTDNYTLPALTNANEVYYDAPGGPNGTGNILPANFAPPVGTNTYYVYAEDNNRVACSDEEAFDVTIYQTPDVAPVTAPITACSATPYILPAYSFWPTTNGAVTKYYTLPGGPLTPLQGTKVPGDQIAITTTLYLYAESGTTATAICPDEEILQINVTPTPVITPAVADIPSCTSPVTLPALTLAANETGGYFSDAAHTLPITTVSALGTTPVYVYIENTTNTTCSVSGTFNVIIYQTPAIDPITAPIQTCSTSAPYQLPPYAFWNTTNGAVSHYFLLPGGPLVSGQTELFPNDPIATTQDIILYAANGTAATTICADEEILQVIVTTTPVINPAVANITGCESVTLTPLLSGNYFSNAAHTIPLPSLTITAIGITTVYVYAESTVNPACNVSGNFDVTIYARPTFVASEIQNRDECNSYTLPALTVGDYYTDATHTTLLPAADMVLTNPTNTVFVYEPGATLTSCDNSATFTVTIFKVAQLNPVTQCGTHTLDTALLSPGAGYFGQTGGVDPLTEVTATRTVYHYATSPVSGCSSETSFLVTINPNAVAYPITDPGMLRICDTDSNPDDFVTDFDLDSLTATILGPQNPAFYTVTYFPSQGDAELNTNQITTDGGAATDTRRTTVYAKVSDGSTSGCEDFLTITINVIPFPHGDAFSGIICNDPISGYRGIDPPLTPPDGYFPSDYTFSWRDAAGVEVFSGYNFAPDVAGNYTLVITAIGLTACESTPIAITVIESTPPQSVDFDIVGMFTDNQTITVSTVPVDNGTMFLYSLDGQTPQTSPIFTGVTSGVHEITVSDVNGCGSLPLPIPVRLVNSPKFFTPNGDGVNDKWKILGLENQVDARLFIYDRYGKLLSQQFLNSGDGWDGTVNGQPLPGNDYWFTITYTDNGVPKEFKSHFSLVR